MLRTTLSTFKPASLLFHETKCYTPKQRTNVRVKWRKYYGSEKYASKMFHPKRNIITCIECGNFHEAHTICRHCFQRLQSQSSNLLEKIREPNPLWFDTNLSQTSANPNREITSSPKEVPHNEVNIKKD